MLQKNRTKITYLVMSLSYYTSDDDCNQDRDDCGSGSER